MSAKSDAPRDSKRSKSAALSKPAASQHLKVLREAGLVHVRVDGNRRLYRSDATRVAELRAALEEFWGDRLARMRDELERP